MTSTQGGSGTEGGQPHPADPTKTTTTSTDSGVEGGQPHPASPPAE
jgi:hypothetical protein